MNRLSLFYVVSALFVANCNLNRSHVDAVACLTSSECGGGYCSQRYCHYPDGGLVIRSPRDPNQDIHDDQDAGAPDAGPTLRRLFFVPDEATLTLNGSSREAVNFQLNVEDDRGNITPAMAQLVQVDRPDMAIATPGSPVVVTASGSLAGTVSIRAVLQSLQATARLNVAQQISEAGNGVTPEAARELTRPNLAQDPALASILYPYEQTVFPLGLASPLVMWNAPRPNDVYLLRYEQRNYRLDVMGVVPSLGQLRAPQLRWDQLTTSNRGEPVRVTLRRYDATAGVAYQSAVATVMISPRSLRGAIYYWTTSGDGHLARIRPGTGAQPEMFGGGGCMGCHAVSADGTTLVASVEAAPSEEGGHRAWYSYDIPSGAVRSTTGFFGANLGLSPDGRYVAFGWDPLKLGDTTTGARLNGTGIESLPLDPGMVSHAHPAFSPDGTRLATVQSSGEWSDWVGSRLSVSNFDASTGAVSATRLLASSTQFDPTQQAIAYPSFTSDSRFVAFHVADHASGCHDQCDETVPGQGSLYLQSESGGAPIRLARLNDSSPVADDHNLSFEPTFNPFRDDDYFWVVFTSTRDWGNRLTGNRGRNGQKRLWVAAIDRNIGSSDPSHPAFFMEGQENTMNMRGFWTLAACIATGSSSSCSAGFECCSGFCDGQSGHCVDPGSATCKLVGESCQTRAECCDPNQIYCSQRVCSIPPLR